MNEQEQILQPHEWSAWFELLKMIQNSLSIKPMESWKYRIEFFSY